TIPHSTKPIASLTLLFQRPPTSRLFPYPTLFRSHHRGVVRPLCVHRERAEHALAELHLHQRVRQRAETHAAILLRHERAPQALRSEEHTSELQSRENLVCRLLLEKKKIRPRYTNSRRWFAPPVCSPKPGSYSSSQSCCSISS